MAQKWNPSVRALKKIVTKPIKIKHIKRCKKNERELSSMSHLREGWKAKCFIL